MSTRTRRAAAVLLLASAAAPAFAQSPELTTPPALRKALPAGAAELNLGGYPVLRLIGAAGGMAPDQRVGVILGRLTPLLGVPNIRPSDVVVFLPSPTSRVNRYPVLYVLGRRVVTVDPITVKAAGGGSPLAVATQWAARLQQVLPRVNWRPSNAPDPKVPAHPPLRVTPDFALVGGDTGLVQLRGKTVLKLRGPQPGGLTAQERADLLTSRLNRLVFNPAALLPGAVGVAAQPNGQAALSLAGTPLITVTDADARAAGLARPALLAQTWAKNLRAALPAAPAPPVAAAPPVSVPPVADTPPPATVPAPPVADAPVTPTAPAPPVVPVTPPAPAPPASASPPSAGG
jgi:hypothetical protein